ncbi:hypothetical protein PRIC1_013027 [Phytophthora ramorum]|nr:hypothetical protein KRP23_8966 [Phytophthora ramorum]KAH7500152.1 hypothetical protein KRP22_9410 [Phytophthora ramorum]
MRVLQIAGLTLLWVWTGVQVTSATSCSSQVSSGDQGVGIWAEDAPTCPTQGGLGCFGGGATCRFCMAFSTDQSKHLLPCAATTATQAPAPSVAPTTTPTVTPKPTAASTSPTASNDDCSEAFQIA